jgi:hypothetical protein
MLGRRSPPRALVQCLKWDHSPAKGDAYHIERVQLNGSIGNPRTLAAQAMPKHVHAEHSRETHVRAMAKVMERQYAPR